MGLVLESRQVPLADVLSALTSFEPACAAACAARVDRAETVLPALRHTLEAAVAAIEDPAAYTGLARRFHLELVAGCGNEAMALAVGALESMWTGHVDELARRNHQHGSFADVAARRKSAREHERLYARIQAGDASGAERAARAHYAHPERGWGSVDRHRRGGHRRLPGIGRRMRAAAITGVGYTALERRSGRSVLELATDACRSAIADAGVARTAVDGIASFAVMHDSVPTQAVATTLALPQLRYALDVDLGGQAPCHLVTQAAAAIATGQADHVLVFRALNGRSGGPGGHDGVPGMGAQFRYPLGYDSLPHVRGHVRAALPARDWARGARHRRGGGDPAPVGRGQRAGLPARAVDDGGLPRRPLRGRALPSAGLHRRGRRGLCRAGERPRSGARPCATRPPWWPRGPTARVRAPGSTSATTCCGTTTAATTPPSCVTTSTTGPG